MNRPEFVHKEQDIAAQLGVALAVLVEQRAKHLIRGKDFERLGNYITYTQGAKDAVLTLFQLPKDGGTLDGQTAPAETPSSPEAGPTAPGVLTPTAEGGTTPQGQTPGPIEQVRPDTVQAVVSAIYRNTRLLGATLGQQEIRVRVRNSRNFIRGMEIPVRHVRDDVYELARRAPRFRGRW